jgi:IMP dehydrogenase/GMP reductase
MDTVTEAATAITMARQGAWDYPQEHEHRAPALEVEKVKKSEAA